VGLAVRDRAGLVALEAPAARDRVDQAARDRVDQAGRAARADRADRVGLGVLEDMNRVAPGVMEDMGPADLGDRADRVGLGVLEDMNRVAPGVMEDMGPADLGDLEDMDLAVPNLASRAALADRVGLRLRALDPEGREARDLSLGRVLRGRTLTALDRVLLDRMPADLDRTRPADRLWEPTTRVEATRPEARMRLAAATLAEATRRAGATHLAEVTDSSGGADASGGADGEGDSLADSPSYAQPRSRLSVGMATNHRL
jgi:hypothetical protein